METDITSKKLAKQLAYVNTIRAQRTVIVGSKERSEYKVVLREMKSEEQITLTIDEMLKQVCRHGAEQMDWLSVSLPIPFLLH